MKKDSKTNSGFKSEVWAPITVGLLTIIIIAIGCIVEGSWTIAYISYPFIVLAVIGLIKYLSAFKVRYFDSRKDFIEEFLKD